MKMIKYFLASLGVASTLGFASAYATDESNGQITISISEYERLKKTIEAQEKDQYWNMTFEQILEEENNNTTKAWELYEYYVLRTVYLDGVVNGGSVNSLIEDFHVLNEIDNTKPITLVIDSPGGSVYDGLRLVNNMTNSKAPINTVCNGMAASMAAVILTVGDERTAYEGCHWMTHQVSAGSPGGQTIDHISWGEWILDLENILLNIISENTGLSIKDVRALGEYETFYSADEILRLGVVDKVEYHGRNLVPGSKTIPENLLPLNRMKENFNERLTK